MVQNLNQINDPYKSATFNVDFDPHVKLLLTWVGLGGGGLGSLWAPISVIQ